MVNRGFFFRVVNVSFCRQLKFYSHLLTSHHCSSHGHLLCPDKANNLAQCTTTLVRPPIEASRRLENSIASGSARSEKYETCRCTKLSSQACPSRTQWHLPEDFIMYTKKKLVQDKRTTAGRVNRFQYSAHSLVHNLSSTGSTVYGCCRSQSQQAFQYS